MIEEANKENLRRRPADRFFGHGKHDVNSKRQRLSQSTSPNKMIVLDSLVNNVSNMIDLNNKAVQLYRKGDFGNASKVFEDATLHSVCHIVSTQHQRRASPHVCQDTIITNDTIAPPTSSYIYQRTEFDEGVILYSEVEVIGIEDHPHSIQATLLFNAGQVRRKLDDILGAAECYEDAIALLLPSETELNEDTSGSVLTTHRIVVPILHNLSQIAYQNGDTSKAIGLYKVALVHCQEFDGQHSLSVAWTLNCLGVMHYHSSIKESTCAVQCLNDALGILRNILGLKSKYEATALNNLGRVHIQRDEFDLALEYYTLSLVIRRDRLGPNHIDYAATAFNAGQTLHQKGSLDKAIELYREFLRVASSQFSQNHRDIAIVLNGIAQIHQQRKEYGKALKLYEESLQVGREALGDYHSEVAMIYNRIGNFHFELENFDKALKAYRKGLHIERRVLEKDHPNIIVTLSNIGEILRQKGCHECALQVNKEAAKLQRTRYGENSAEVASTLNVIALIYDQMGNSDKAIKVFQKALAMRRSVIGDDHLDVSCTLTFLATIFYRKSMVSTAIELFSESLRIRQIKLGQNHRTVSFTLYNIGLCHQSQGNLMDAIDCFKETLRIEKAVLGGAHKDVSMTLIKLGEIYNANGDLDGALSSFKDALVVERNMLGQQNPEAIARIMNEIGNIYLDRGDVVPMMEAFGEASRIFLQAGFSPENVAVSRDLYHFRITCPNAAPAA